MGFKDNYTTKDKFDTDQIKEKDKVIVSVDTFAMGDVIDELIRKLEHTRLSLI